MNVQAVVVNWNGGEENVLCLRALRAEGLPEERIVFVDNGSSDGSLARVRAAFPALRLVENAENLGYGHASNQGIELALAAGAEAVFLVNNDLELAPGALALLSCAIAADPATGIVGPRVLYKDRPAVVWAAGGRLTFRQNLTTLLGHRRPDAERWRRSFAVDYVPGCAMLVRRAVFERTGLLNADYFAYHEDVEFCLLAAEAGFATRLVGEAAAYHAASTSTGGGYNVRRKWMMGVNTVWFLRRHGTPGRWARFFVFDVLSLPFVWVVEAFRGRGRAVLAKARGMRDGFRGKRVRGEDLLPGHGPYW